MPGEEWETDNSVPLTIQEIEQARVTLATEMTPNVFVELPRLLEELARLNADLVQARNSKSGYPWHPFGSYPTPEEIVSSRLCTLTDQAFAEASPLRLWYRMGGAVGRCCTSLSVEWPHRTTDFCVIALAASKLPVPERTLVPILQSLAKSIRNPNTVTELAVLRQFLERNGGSFRRFSVSDLEMDPHCDKDVHPTHLDSLLGELDAQIRHKLLRVSQRQTIRLSGLKPHWDEDSHQLLVGDEVARKIIKPAEATRIIPVLEAFERAGWPPAIPNPFTRAGIPNVDQELRYQTISSLNDGIDFIRFSSDGTNDRIQWQWE